MVATRDRQLYHRHKSFYQMNYLLLSLTAARIISCPSYKDIQYIVTAIILTIIQVLIQLKII